MQSKCIQENGARTYVVAFDEGDEVAEGLCAFARQESLHAARFTAIGAFQDATLGFFDMEKQDYDRIRVDEQVEVLTLAGNVAVHDGAPKVHAHVVLGKRDGSALGGHLLEAHVRPTLEVMITEAPGHLHRKIDERTGLPLLSV